MRTVRDLAFDGVDDTPGLRSLYWKLLLQYLPLEKGEWEGELRRQRALYDSFKSELIVTPEGTEKASSRPARLEGQAWWEHCSVPDLPASASSEGGSESASAETSGADPLQITEPLAWEVAEDDPLSAKPGSKWASWFEDNELREEIWKDVQRTHPGLHFFTQGTYEEMERVLFIYAKLNPGVKYVQGMNEVLAPIFFVFGHDKSALFAGHHEADAFFCFTQLMAEIRDLFIKGLDASEGGLRGNMECLMALLRCHDPKLRDHLEECQVNPQFFALRWFTTLLSRELVLPDAVRLWDSLLADTHRFQPGPNSFLLHFCCAMLMHQRDTLLSGDFAIIIKLLQNYPMVDLQALLDTAYHVSLIEEKRARGEPIESLLTSDATSSVWQQSYSAAKERVGARASHALRAAEAVKREIKSKGLVAWANKSLFPEIRRSSSAERVSEEEASTSTATSCAPSKASVIESDETKPLQTAEVDAILAEANALLESE